MVRGSTWGKTKIGRCGSNDIQSTFFSRFDQFLGDEHKEQIYNRGTKCWNGPERSVHAKFECGGETEIIEVTEPEKCEYRYRLKTPAVCPLTDELKQEGKGRPVHEEL